MINSNTYKEDLTYVATLPIFDKLKNKSIMITGACGLIGSFIVDVIIIYLPDRRFLHDKACQDNPSARI